MKTHLIYILLIIFLIISVINIIRKIYSYKLNKINHFYPKISSINNQQLYNDIPLNAYTHWHSKDLFYYMYNTILNNINNNPEINFYIYDDIESRNFIKSNFTSKILYAYDQLIPSAYKSDLFRYCILYANGGIYFDIKFIINVKLIELIKKYNTIFVKDLVIDYKSCENGTYNGFIISYPKNPFFLDCINLIINNINNNYYGKNALYPTGPCMLGYLISTKYKNITHNLFLKSKSNKYGSDEYVISDENNNEIIIPYLDYRKEQKLIKNNVHYGDLWLNKQIYLKN